MPIKPLDPNLLQAPSAAESPGLQPRRRLAIYFQDAGTAPVVPEIDAGIDIAQPVLDRFVEYAADKTSANAIPVAGLPIVSGQDVQQKKFLDPGVSGVPNAETLFNARPTFFPAETVVPDRVGEYQKPTTPGTRTFQINAYNRLAINAADGKGHGDLIDRVRLNSSGFNSKNKFFVATDEPDGVKLGSVFYKQLGSYVSGSYLRPTPDGQTLTDAGPLTIQELKNIGLNMMFEGVQGVAGLDYAVKGEDEASTIETEGRMALPSPQRLGKRVSLDRFTPAFQLKKLTGASKPSNQGFVDTTKDVETYGSYYNAFSQFDSLIPAGQVAVTVVMIVAYVTLLSTLTAIIRLANPADEEANFVSLTAGEKHRTLGAARLPDASAYPTTQSDAGDVFTEVLGLQRIFTPTNHSAQNSLNAGVNEFFGFSFDGFGSVPGVAGPAGARAASSATKVLTESGRLSTILREVLRSGLTVFENASADFTGGVSLASIGNLVKRIRDLKITKFVNVLMQIGDKVLYEADIRTQANVNRRASGASQDETPPGNVSYVDSLPDTRSYLVAKSRLSNGRGLAWQNSTAGMLSLPLGRATDPRGFVGSGYGRTSRNNESTNTWQAMGLELGVMENGSTLKQLTPDEEARTLQADRLPAEVVREVEDLLEADYMPFSLQDLRTNEVLSFHAFLEDVSEDFNIEYSSQDGYGRMDKVQIYKGTTRTVNVSFKMVATSPNDHNLMWFKLNKLAMLIYPQWTQGRKISIENINFIQPFSQIPGATPVVRLRLGDLLKSNYSKMAVARLFGATTNPEYNVNGAYNRQQRTSAGAASSTTPASIPTAGAERAPGNIEAIRERANRVASTTPISLTSQISPQTSQVSSYGISDILAPGDEIVLNPSHTPGLRGYRVTAEGREVSIPSGATPPHDSYRVIARYVGQTEQSLDPRRSRRTTSGIRVVPLRYVSSLAPNALSYPIRGESSELVLPLSSLNSAGGRGGSSLDRAGTSALLQRAANNSLTQTQRESSQEERTTMADMSPSTFYDETKNPIMRAFKSSGGKGLAGVVTSFKVDYGESKGTWGTDRSSLLRAPKIVTVTLGLAVIHDITPGLDARGIMWAPIWPVGNLANQFVNNGTDNPSRATGTPASAPTDFFDPATRTFINRKG